MRKCDPMCRLCVVACSACVFLPQLFRGSNGEEEILGGKRSSPSSLFNVTCLCKRNTKEVPAL